MICSEKKVITDSRVAMREVIRAERLARPLGNTTPPPNPEPELICWWCVHSLPQRPCIHLPTKYDEKKNVFVTRGNFCSWACAKSFAIDMRTSRSGEIQMILAMMRRRAFGKYIPLFPAPKREALAVFGGTMTIDEFRSYGGLVESPPVYFPDEKQLHQKVGLSNDPERTVEATRVHSNSKNKLDAIETAMTQGDTLKLKLKRDKPLERSKSKLENVLGITRKTKS